MTAPKEIEFKFENLANTQLKFIATENAETILLKLKTLCKLLDIQVGAVERVEIIDEYFDDNEYTLQNNRCALRRRKLESGKHRVTMKFAQEASAARGLQRLEDEFECDDQEFRSILNNPDWISRRFKERFGFEISCRRLIKMLTVTNRRTKAPLVTKAAAYEFCHDKFYYFDENEGNYSEYYAEIEIELAGQHLLEDVQLEKLTDAITQLLNYAPNPKTKFERGIERFVNRAEDIETVYAVAIDIIGYSRRQADSQKQMIQKLNHYIKEAIRAVRGHGAEQSVIYLPTGDGMIMVFDSRPETLVPIVCNVQKEIKRYNQSRAEADRFEFRTGLHSGQVFKFSDVNENLNFAGNGINIAQRVMSLGDRWHILATQAGYEAMGNVKTENNHYFKPVGRYSIKHGDEIEVYNVYSQQDRCGNPAAPLK